MTSTWCRALTPAAVFFAALLPVHAQQQPPQPRPQQNPFCSRLEAQLRVRPRQQRRRPRRAGPHATRRPRPASRPRSIARRRTAQRAGCESNSFFVLFSGQQAQCAAAQQADPADAGQPRPHPGRPGAPAWRLRARARSQRRAILVALAQNNCGQQYSNRWRRAPPPRGGLFESLFGPKSVFAPGNARARNVGAGRQLPHRLRAHLRRLLLPDLLRHQSGPLCRGREDLPRSPARPPRCNCYSHRNPGEDINQAVSINGQQPYTALPNAFRYRTAFDQSCSCRRPGESWAAGLEEHRRHDRRAGRHRGERRARPAVVAAARRCAGQADPASAASPRRPGAARSTAAQTAPPAAAACRRRRAAADEDRPSPIPTARCARSARRSSRRRVTDLSEIERFGLA